jgi:nucleoid DNA-binding protein
MEELKMGPNTWPSKQRHVVGVAEMFTYYKRKMSKKAKETGNPKWKKKLTKKQHAEIITDLYLQIENRVVVERKTTYLPFFGGFSLRKRKTTLNIDQDTPEFKLTKLLGLVKEFYWKFHWEKRGTKFKNSPFYKFKLYPHSGNCDRGACRIVRTIKI